MKRKSNSTKTAQEHAKVRKVSPYFQKDSEKTVNVKVQIPIPIEMFKYKGKNTYEKEETTEVGAELCSADEYKPLGKRYVSPYFYDNSGKKIVVSPYFDNDSGKKIDMKTNLEHKQLGRRYVSRDSGKKIVLSPYFQNQNDSEKKSNVNTKSLIHKNLSPANTYVSPLDEGIKLESIALTAEHFGEENKLSKKSVAIKKNLSASEKWLEAYRRKTSDNTWKPPRSATVLIQEDHAHDPWRVLVICMLLNRTSGTQTKKIISDFFKLCPDAKSCTKVARKDIEETIRTLGFQHKRAKMIQRLSEEYLEESWTHVTQLHGVGKYAADAYAIFVNGMWDKIKPADHMLNYYWEFLHRIYYE